MWNGENYSIGWASGNFAVQNFWPLAGASWPEVSFPATLMQNCIGLLKPAAPDVNGATWKWKPSASYPISRFANMPSRAASCFPCMILIAHRSCPRPFPARRREKWMLSKLPRMQKRFGTAFVYCILLGARVALLRFPWERLVFQEGCLRCVKGARLRMRRLDRQQLLGKLACAN